ncbi:MAG TPA: Ig-like domain-containing protein, partial [Clostridia bacterium]|nr:Ig-like domain-containing protein [Clostridia bacterium]
MRKKLLTAIIILMILLSAVALASCDFLGAEAETRVTAVQIADTEIYMSPYGEPSVFQLRPWVIPSDAKNQELTYKVVNYEDREYLAVDSTGRITATRAKEEGRVTIRITSKDNPKAYVDVYVTVEVVAVKKISFVPPEMSLLLGDAPKAIKPQFTPAHAVLGRNVSYASLNENVATVDTNGYVTPVGVGKTTIWVTASNDQNLPEDQLVKGNLQISVNYTPPNFRLSVTDPARALKQIVGDPTPIVLSLVALDRTCDPTPLIGGG